MSTGGGFSRPTTREQWLQRQRAAYHYYLAEAMRLRAEAEAADKVARRIIVEMQGSSR
jgi:hypothetical protein